MRRKLRSKFPLVFHAIGGFIFLGIAPSFPADQANRERQRILAERLAETNTDYVRERAAFRALRERDENGVIPAGAKLAAIARFNELLARPSERGLIASLPVGSRETSVDGRWLAATAGLNPAHTLWRSLGPANIGGRTRSVIVMSVSGGRDSRIWLGSAGGGIWANLQGGGTFYPVDDLMANLAISCMAIHPKDSNVVYAGTGEGFYNQDALRGSGIFRTTDGKKWEQLPATVGPQFSFVNRIAISPDGNVLLAAARGPRPDFDSPRISDPAASPAPQPGVLRSDDPDHTKWKRVLDAEIADVKFHPFDPKRAVAGGLYTGQAYYSSDGGITWKLSSHESWGDARVELAFTAKNSSVVYASVDIHKGELWRSDDSGKTYKKEVNVTADGGAPEYLGTQGWYDNAVWAGDPDNEDLIVVGGIDLWKREKRGGPFIKISNWEEDESAHSDVHAITADPQFKTNRSVLVGTDGGLYKGDLSKLGNDKEHHPWTKLTNGYCVTQFYAIAGNPATGTIIGGSQDNGTLRYTKDQGAANWWSMFGGDGGSCAFDPSDPNYYYGEYVKLSIHRSSNGGESSDFIGGQADWNSQTKKYNWKKPPFLIPDAQDERALFIAPFILDPGNPNRLLAGGASLWETKDAKTTDPGPSWSKLKDEVSDRDGNPAHISAIVAFKGDSSGSNIIWVGHRDGQVYNTSDSLQGSESHWKRVDRDANGLQILPRRYCTHLAVDPKNDKTCYATFGGYATGNIWKTTDFGSHWANIGALLPPAPVNAVTVHPKNSHFVYIGTDLGVFASEDGGANWSPTNEGPTNCAVLDLQWMENTLLAGTFGRGVFSIDLSSVNAPEGEITP